MATSDDDSVELKLWEYAASSSGTAYILREIKKSKASVQAVAKLERAMQRLESGTAKAAEYDLVRKGVYELRVDEDKRWYRLLYGRNGSKYVALIFIVKKKNKLDPTDIDTAIARLAEHLKNH